MIDTLTPPLTAPALPGASERLVRAGRAVWRVHDDQARILGHLRVLGEGSEQRYRAECFHHGTGQMLVLGEFWRATDAVETLRHLH